MKSFSFSPKYLHLLRRLTSHLNNVALELYKKGILCSEKNIEFSTATSAAKQTGVLVNSFTKIEKKTFAEVSGIEEVQISAEEMIALKSKLGIAWGKLNTMGR